VWGRAGHRTTGVSKAPKLSVQEGFIAQFLLVRRHPRPPIFNLNKRKYIYIYLIGIIKAPY